jgi:hypothetical protein
MSEPFRLCTYFDGNYATKFRLMAKSVARHMPGVRIDALCLDEAAREAADDLANVDPLWLPDFQRVIGLDLTELKSTRSHAEWCWTMTPFWMYHCIQSGRTIYVDADSWFMSAPGPEILDHGVDIGIVGHRFPPRHRHREKANGRFNVNWVDMRPSDKADECLADWLEACHRKCSLHDGCGDQKHLDLWPSRYGAVEIGHIGLNVAPWNQEGYMFSNWGDGKVGVYDGTVDRQLVMYHFHEFTAPGRRGNWPLSEALVKHVYEPYETAWKEETR